jgi:hypothetical protein
MVENQGSTVTERALEVAQALAVMAAMEILDLALAQFRQVLALEHPGGQAQFLVSKLVLEQEVVQEARLIHTAAVVSLTPVTLAQMALGQLEVTLDPQEQQTDTSLDRQVAEVLNSGIQTLSHSWLLLLAALLTQTLADTTSTFGTQVEDLQSNGKFCKT